VRSRVAGALIGVVFGITLCWSGMSNPAVIREALLFQRAYLFLMFASAVLVAAVGLRVLRRRRAHALLTGAPLTWTRDRPRRRHVVGSVLFGLGWGIADACPGPIAAQVGQGVPWALFTLAGVLAGVYLFLRGGTAETEPAADAGPAEMAAA
jgi:uncharacterized membrane protein YedE/YeeE